MHATMDNQYQQYRGLRTLELTRVSTLKQEEGYGHPAQDQECREKLIQPLALKVIDTVRIAHSGLDFLDSETADEILRRAKNNEFELLIMDVLDRLGRKGLERELWRMQLRATGARVLTTDPADHADDDTLTGEIVRLINGHGSEQEVNNIRRRTMNGRRAKVEGDKSNGVEPKILGNGHRYYGYKFVLDERGKRVGIILNHDVIKVDEDGTEWTEVKVILFIFESAVQGMPLHKICKFLNDKGIPSPYVAKGIHNERTKYPIWHVNSLCRFLRQSVYWGEARFNKAPLLKEPGKGKNARRNTTEEEQLVVSVPAIVTKELAEQAQRRVVLNKKHSARYNTHPEESLLRAGFARCAHCERAMRVSPHIQKNKDGERRHLQYSCRTNQATPGVCKGCTINVSILDAKAWKKVIELINDPREVDERVAKARKEDPTIERRKGLEEKREKIRNEQASMQDYLSKSIRNRTLDSSTETRLVHDLHQLDKGLQDCERLIANEEKQHERWKKVEKKLDELHQECIEMRELLRDPNYEPPYQKKRDLLTFFGITALVSRGKGEGRINIECNPPDIVALLS
jgi:site-specific DNA recombinase